MGRDEHKTSRGKRHLAQTPKNQVSDGIDVEFSEEIADRDDHEAKMRSAAATRRVKGKK